MLQSDCNITDIFVIVLANEHVAICKTPKCCQVAGRSQNQSPNLSWNKHTSSTRHHFPPSHYRLPTASACAAHMKRETLAWEWKASWDACVPYCFFEDHSALPNIVPPNGQCYSLPIGHDVGMTFWNYASSWQQKNPFLHFSRTRCSTSA